MVLALFSTLEIVNVGFGDSTPGVVLLGVVLAATVAWRRTRPLVAVAAGMGAYSLLAVVDVHSDDLNGVSAALLVLVYSVGMWEQRQPALAGLAVTAVALAVLMFSAGKGAGDYLWAAMLAGGTWGLGRAMRARLLEVSRLAEAATRAQLEREHEAATAIAGERSRIARELHDIVSHGLSVMVVQAAAAECAIADAPDEAAMSMRAIQEVGREAQTEMGRMLGLLRQGSADGPLAPVPGVGDIGALVERMQAAGLPVALAIEGEPRAVPGGLGLTAYRVVQEALTNVRRHAGAVETAVHLTFSPSCLRVAISNAPGQCARERRGGHGLMGMRERVAACGGQLSTTSGEDGGFIVVAELPLTGRERAV